MFASLERWAEVNVETPPALRTLRAWAKAGRFSPPAIKAGRSYLVRIDADLVEPPEFEVPPGMSERAQKILRGD